MKTYIWVVIFFVLTVLIFGFVGPYLVSSTSNELVLIGVGLIIVIIPIFFFVFKQIILKGRNDYEKIKNGGFDDSGFDDSGNDNSYNRMQQGSSRKRRY